MQKREQQGGSGLNIGSSERLLTALGGGLMVAYGLRQGNRGIPLVLMGGAIAVRGISGHSPIYRALGVNHAGDQVSEISHALTIAAEPDSLYRIWRDLAGLPRFMTQITSVSVLDERRSRWVAQAPGGKRIEWEVELIEDQAPSLIAWRALPDQASLWNAGQVEFQPAPGERGTEVCVTMTYHTPAGALGRLVAAASGQEPSLQVLDSLRRLKMWQEAGEITTSAMRRDQDWEQGRQPWQREAEQAHPDQAKEVGS